jgi:hypothetical protein
MTKKELIENPNSPLNKAADDEPLFVLRSQDVCGPLTVIDWMNLAHRAGASLPKLGGAFEDAAEMLRWQAERGCKVPD